jgi:Ca2+-binding RTX toxin-like protein
MSRMFLGVNSSIDIGGWDVSQVTNMSHMLESMHITTDLGSWDLSSLVSARYMLHGSRMSVADFDATLEGWARLDPGETRIPTGIDLGLAPDFSNIAAYTILTDTYGWTINATRVYGQTDGDDVIDLSAEPEGVTVMGLDGDDRIIGSAFNDVIFGDDKHGNTSGSDTIEGGLGADHLVGGIGNDVLYGGRMGADLPQDGPDRIYGGAGNDYLNGGYGNDELRGDDGKDTIDGGAGVDTIVGGFGDDVLNGQTWSDVILGGDGFDFINGGFGHDRVNGGGDADQFYHMGVEGHGSDWVQDFSAAEGDTLVFGGAGTIGDFQVNFTETANAGAAGVQEAFVIYKPNSQILWALVDGGALEEINIVIGGTEYDLLG